MKITTQNANETIALGEALGKRLKPGDTIALVGDLGSGKTTFTKGIARGLRVRDVRYVNSPTFVIIKEYQGKIPLNHIDVYRLEGKGSLETIPFDDYFYGNGVTVVEWADKIRTLLPRRHIRVEFRTKDEHSRSIVFKRMPSGYRLSGRGERLRMTR